jgi:hypothetical protein
MKDFDENTWRFSRYVGEELGITTGRVTSQKTADLILRWYGGPTKPRLTGQQMSSVTAENKAND